MVPIALRLYALLGCIIIHWPLLAFPSARVGIIRIAIILTAKNALQHVCSAMENPLSVQDVCQLPQTLNTSTTQSAIRNALREPTQSTPTSPAKPATLPSTARLASARPQTALPALPNDSFPNLSSGPVFQVAQPQAHTPFPTSSTTSACLLVLIIWCWLIMESIIIPASTVQMIRSS